MLVESGLVDLIGGEDVASDTGLTKAVAKNPSMILQLDEIGHFFANANSKYSGSHQKQILPTLTKLFTNARNYVPGKVFANADRTDIDQPNVGLYGTTVPGKFYQSLTSDEVDDGFLPRMLIFRTRDDRPAHDRMVEEQPVPQSVMQQIDFWARRQMPVAAGNLAGRTTNVPHIAIATGSASDILSDFASMASRKITEVEAAGYGPMWSRAIEHATKVSAVVASGIDGGLEVTADVATWSCDLVRFLVEDFIREMGTNLASSAYESDSQFVIRIIRQAGPAGITKSDLIRRTRRLNPQVRDMILRDMAEARLIGERQGARGSRGPAPAVYFAAK
jgi:hypothetical protein